MHNISPDLRDWLAANFFIPQIADESTGAESGPRKMLVELEDGDSVEAVIIPSRASGGEPRTTVCISCQVGCRFNCAFCASGKAGLIRNLNAGEMVFQVVAAASIINKRPSNIVFMGIGEPFDNYDEVLKAARILNDADGLKIGARKITVSTSGIIPGIERFAAEPEQFELSVSLHAPSSELRSKLMPVNKRYPLPDLLEACRSYTRTTKRIITFEYTLIKDFNDRPEHAFQLAKLLRKFPCRVNLIPLSPVAEFDGQPSARQATDDFVSILTDARINTTLRNSQGAVLKAACGQLRFSKRNT
jgi:23S rRNA (adenine2503-C2)-methyltransferase